MQSTPEMAEPSCSTVNASLAQPQIVNHYVCIGLKKVTVAGAQYQ